MSIGDGDEICALSAMIIQAPRGVYSMTKQETEKSKTFSGDTLIEVLFGISIFSAVAISTIAIMNSGINQAQRALELTMARNEVDAQAEAIRFIQNNYVAERQYPPEQLQFTELWEAIIARSINSNLTKDAKFDMQNGTDTCEQAYANQITGNTYKAFALNPRFIKPRSIIDGSGSVSSVSASTYRSRVIPEILITSNSGKMRTAGTHPRVIYKSINIPGTNINEDTLLNVNYDEALSENNIDARGNKSYFRSVDSVEGLWVIAVQGDKSSMNRDTTPEYYDFLYPVLAGTPQV